MGSSSGRVLVWGKTGSHISHPPHIVSSAASTEEELRWKRLIENLQSVNSQINTAYGEWAKKGILNPPPADYQYMSNNAEHVIARELGIHPLDVSVKEVDGRVHIQVDDKKFSVSKTQIEKWRSLGIDPYKNIASRIARHIRAR